MLGRFCRFDAVIFAADFIISAADFAAIAAMLSPLLSLSLMPFAALLMLLIIAFFLHAFSPLSSLLLFHCFRHD